MSRFTFIMGAPRSGCGLTARVFAACGAALGRAHYHPHTKHPSVRKWLDASLQVNGYDKDGLGEVPAAPLEVPAASIYLLRKLISDADVVQDPRLAFFWPALVAAFPDARFVLCYRAPQVLAKIYHEAPFMRSRERLSDWEDLARTYQKHCNDLSSATKGRRARWTVPEDMSAGLPFATCSALEASGLEWTPEAEQVFKPQKWRTRA